MPQFFVDTWYWIAELRYSDADHVKAKLLARKYSGARLITHDGVLTELLAFFSGFGQVWRYKASQAVRMLAGRRVEVIPQDRALFLKALALYEERPDKGYSLVDCISFVVMRERGITHALTNDHHFTQEKFTIVSE